MHNLEILYSNPHSSNNNKSSLGENVPILVNMKEIIFILIPMSYTWLWVLVGGGLICGGGGGEILLIN